MRSAGILRRSRTASCGRLDSSPRALQVWLGVSSWDIGGQFELRRWFQMVADFGTDGAGGWFAVLAPTFRF